MGIILTVGSVNPCGVPVAGGDGGAADAGVVAAAAGGVAADGDVVSRGVTAGFVAPSILL